LHKKEFSLTSSKTSINKNPTEFQSLTKLRIILNLEGFSKKESNKTPGKEPMKVLTLAKTHSIKIQQDFNKERV
jgi:hypothetical protein